MRASPFRRAPAVVERADETRLWRRFEVGRTNTPSRGTDGMAARVQTKSTRSSATSARSVVPSCPFHRVATDPPSSP